MRNINPLGDMAKEKQFLHVLAYAYTHELNSTKSMTGHLLGQQEL
jgi:hypothetical protein